MGERTYCENAKVYLVDRRPILFTDLYRFSDEIDRNRAKIIEINTFIDKQRDLFEHLHEEVEKEKEKLKH